jgi:hypothetical protein
VTEIPIQGTHVGLRSEHGALAGEHPGLGKNPVIKVRGLPGLEFAKLDLGRQHNVVR